METRAGNREQAEMFLQKALQDAPKKAKTCVYIEWSRFFEYHGDFFRANEKLQLGKAESDYEWKVIGLVFFVSFLV